MEKLRSRKYFTIQLIAGIAAIVAVAILYFFPPTEHSFYPRCVFRSLTGLNCPGCGSLRAMHGLLHGNLSGAFHLNPAFVISLPLLGIFALRRMVRARSKN